MYLTLRSIIIFQAKSVRFTQSEEEEKKIISMKIPSLVFVITTITSATAFTGVTQRYPYVVPTTQLYSEPPRQNEAPRPANFREAEVYGLRLMQEGKYEEALKGKYLYI